MSLGKLLTSGKCLVGLNDNEGRYEMRSKNLLPKFGSARNPFATTRPQPLQVEFSRKLATVVRTLTPTEAAAAKLKKTQPLPAITAMNTEAKTVSGATTKSKALTHLRNGLKKMNPLNWFGRGKLVANSSAPRPGKAPVQAELSLEKIKVVRNDLSDADLEVVPVKISVKPKTEPVAPPSAKAGETAELIKA
ncbi:MAG: hypothetical protein H7Y43_05680 [Akkermansiaceae bacterium]|nr:hypothetical protein [Verrucomicrobiales bacterium]